MTTGERTHGLRMSDERWATLTALAAATVRDDEMPNGTGRDDNRIGTMLRLLADGKLSVVRVEETS